MTTPLASLFAAAALAVGVAVPLTVQPTPQDPQGQGAPDMKAMMEKAAKFTKPGAHHKELERFVGKWKTQTRLFMGDQATPGSAGEAEYTWLMPGRWLQGSWTSSMMGMPYQGSSLMGYDNFKQSFVYTQVTSMDTAMNRAEGDMDPSGKALLMYGTLDEYLTGEHDKMVKYVWRFPSADEMVLEVHDLPIGEKNAKVVEATFTRVK